MIRIADGRSTITCLEEARDVMAEIAHLECEIAYSAAMSEKQIQAAKERHADRVADKVTELTEAAKSLSTFIMANKHLFQKPRKVATDFGSFGLQSVSEVVITDQDALLQALMEHGYVDSFKEVRTPDKTRIKERLLAEEALPGCVLNIGDTAVYKTAKAMIDEARERAAG